MLAAPIIARLPEILINQIAAGEVVERPASAIKELVENSLDAGSTRIEILLQGGGTEEITIVDNGCGMVPEDLLLCIERHATSKIRNLEELEAVGSYGFRGEALSSIASVSRLEIVSRVESAVGGHAVAVDFGVPGELRPTGCPVGTRVTVRDLFCKLPARQKFLRSVGTEFAACARMVRELALGNPGVDFFLHHQGRRVCEFVGPSRADRFREGFKAAWEPLVVHELTEGAELECYLSPPQWVQDRGELLIFLNRRTIRNRNLAAAVRNAYLTALGPHHEPSGVVFLDLRPEWVDVNVHPQKLEVRCLRQETLYPWILTAVRKALSEVTPPVARSANAPATAPVPSVPVFVSAPSAPAVLPEPGYEYPAGSAGARFLGLAGNRFLLGEDGRGLVVIDTRLAARRQRLRALRAELAQGSLPSQRLLDTPVVRLPLDLHAVFEDNADQLSRFGFEAEPFGDGDYTLQSAPAGVEPAEAERVWLAILRALSQRGQRPVEAVALATLAESCGDDRLPPSQALALFAEDESFGHRIDFATLEKQFARTTEDEAIGQETT